MQHGLQVDASVCFCLSLNSAHHILSLPPRLPAALHAWLTCTFSFKTCIASVVGGDRVQLHLSRQADFWPMFFLFSVSFSSSSTLPVSVPLAPCRCFSQRNQPIPPELDRILLDHGYDSNRPSPAVATWSPMPPSPRCPTPRRAPFSLSPISYMLCSVLRTIRTRFCPTTYDNLR